MSAIKPVMTIAPTLGMFKRDVIRIDCAHCARKGLYSRDRAIQRHGKDFTLQSFIRLVARDCPRPVDKCKAGCDDLIYMFNEAPEPHKR